MEIVELITHDELNNAVEEDHSNSNFKIHADFLLSAVNDWPSTNLTEPKDFVFELKKVIEGPLTFENIRAYLEKLNLDTDAWKIESLTSILEMLDFGRNDLDSEVTLEEVIVKITRHYRLRS